MRYRARAKERLSLGYGCSSVSLELGGLKELVIADTHKGGRNARLDFADLVSQVLHRPHQSAPLRTLVHSRDQVAILVPDITRRMSLPQILPHLIEELGEAGIGEEQIEIVFATGIHRAHTPNEQHTLLGEELTRRMIHYDHDAYGSEFISRGTTRGGTPVELNSRLRGRKLIIVSSLSYHYFAGFGGGRKLVLPGVCSVNSCTANHRRFLRYRLRAHQSLLARLHGNPVHYDMVDAVNRVEPLFALFEVGQPEEPGYAILAGHWHKTHLRAARLFHAHHSIELPGKFDVVVVSAGGEPYDLNFIQAHKALENVMRIVKPGGTILALFHCRNGWGHPTVPHWLNMANFEAMTSELEQRYEIYGQSIWAARVKARQASIFLYSSLDKEEVAQLGYTSVDQLADFWPQLVCSLKPGQRLCIVPWGARYLLNPGKASKDA